MSIPDYAPKLTEIEFVGKEIMGASIAGSTLEIDNNVIKLADVRISAQWTIDLIFDQ